MFRLEKFSRREFGEISISAIGPIILRPILTPIPTPKPTATEATPIPNSTEAAKPIIEKYQAPLVFSRGNPNTSFVHLTFDDGWNPLQVGKILDIAQQYGIKVTFFPAGIAAEQNPDIWKKAFTQGHEIELHTYSHDHITPYTPSQKIRSEISKNIQVLQTILGSEYTPHFFRPPFGDGYFSEDIRMEQIIQDFGLKEVIWTADSRGWANADYPTVLRNCSVGYKNGGIILMHTVLNDTVALPTLVEQLQANSLQPVPLAQVVI